MTRYLVVANMAALLFLFTGCALTTDTIQVHYRGMKATRLAEAEGIRVKVVVADARKDKTRVSVKKNGYGMEMAPIIASGVEVTLTQAIESELTGRGFSVGEGNILLTVELSKFFNDFKVGLFSGDAVAELAMTVQVKKPDGTIALVKNVVGEGTNSGIMVSGGDEAKVALEQALRDGIAKLFADREFIDTLTRQARQPGA